MRARLPLGRDFERDAGLLGLLYSAADKDLWQSQAISYSARPTLDVISHLTGRRDSQAPRAVIARALLRNKRADPPLETDGRAAPGRPDVMIADTVVVSWARSLGSTV